MLRARPLSGKLGHYHIMSDPSKKGLSTLCKQFLYLPFLEFVVRHRLAAKISMYKNLVDIFPLFQQPKLSTFSLFRQQVVIL